MKKLVPTEEEFTFPDPPTPDPPVAKRLPNISEVSCLRTKKKSLIPKTETQRAYIAALQSKDLVFATGPAGTGKTYLAVAYAASLFERKLISKIVLCRPAVEAGEKLGFLPGDLRDKIDVYLLPLYDALHEFLPKEKVERALETGDIEIAPLAFMRGRTFKDAYIIIDEANNTTVSQMKLILTRIGENTRIVVSGDISQCDLPRGIPSGLADAVRLFRGLPEVGLVEFTKGDVVRSGLVKKVVEIYEDDAAEKRGEPTWWDEKSPAPAFLTPPGTILL
jgi:phosphate starvation-inducible protein PhoH and related proteins